MSFIGPPLPPGLSGDQREEDKDKEDDDKGSHGTSTFGPQLPRHVTRQENADGDGDSSLDKERFKPAVVASSSCYGATLPSESKTSSNDDVAASSSYGPSLPPGFGVDEGEEEEERQSPSNRSRVVGPSLPPGVGVAGSEEEEEDDDIIGPMPVRGGVSEAEERFRKKKEFEYRAKVMKDKILGKDLPVAPQREEWMTELPPEIKPSGIGARKFRTTAVDLGDRSVWTETPADRQRKEQEAMAGGPRDLGKKKKREKEKLDHHVVERDKQLAALVEEHNTKHRSKSLMEMHTKKRKIEERDKGKGQERRPFDRETDLDVRSSLVTPTKRKALMKDSRTSLNSKFTHGSRSFL